MSTDVFPSLQGLGWGVKRTPVWSTRVQTAVSGREVRTAQWSYPRWRWELSYDFLRADFHGDFQALLGFFNRRLGQYDSFLFRDPDDNTATGQALGTGDGTTTLFQAVRSFAGVVEPVWAIDAIAALYINGVAANGWNWARWDGTFGFGGAPAAPWTPGQIGFTTAPPAGAVISADFTFFWPCRFEEDSLEFEKFLFQLWQAKSVKIISLK